MRFPLMLRSTHDYHVGVYVARYEEKLRDTEAQLAYWRNKCEQLLDHALFRERAITAPVFTPPPEKRTDPMLTVLSALSKTEIESKPTGGPVTPMT